MAKITCTHDELAFKPGKHDTVGVRCMIDAQVALQMRKRADELGMSMQEFAERAIKLAISIGKMAKDVPLDFDPDDYPL